MGQQHRKVAKRRRRINYIKRKKELEQGIPVRLAVSVAKDDDSDKKAAATKKKAVAPKTEAAPAKKAPAKKAPAKKAPEADSE